jgi:MarR family transcriptional repressor of mepA
MYIARYVHMNFSTEQIIHFIIMLKKIDSGVDLKSNTILRKWGLTHSQFKILLYLMQNKRKFFSQKDLEHHFHITNPTISGILNRLEKNGFIRREINQSDARFRQVVLMEQTLSMENHLLEAVQEMGKILFKGISKEELEQASSILGKLLKNLPD